MGQTDKWALPYPEADTLISVSAPIVQELAEKIDAALTQVTASDSYTVPGTLVQDFTASGTFTPPPGVTVVHVVVVGVLLLLLLLSLLRRRRRRLLLFLASEDGGPAAPDDGLHDCVCVCVCVCM